MDLSETSSFAPWKSHEAAQGMIAWIPLAWIMDSWSMVHGVYGVSGSATRAYPPPLQSIQRDRKFLYTRLQADRGPEFGGHGPGTPDNILALAAVNRQVDAGIPRGLTSLTTGSARVQASLVCLQGRGATTVGLDMQCMVLLVAWETPTRSYSGQWEILLSPSASLSGHLAERPGLVSYLFFVMA